MGIRQAQANVEIEAEWQNAPRSAPELAATARLEIIPLYEETGTGNGLIGGHGVSYLVRTAASTILLDVGNNPDNLPVLPFVQNMRALGIFWREIDAVVVSHPHPDHVGGTEAWNRRTISFGELPEAAADLKVYLPSQMTFTGAVRATQPGLLTPEVATTGVISYPEVFPLSVFEPKGSEQALVVKVAGEGLVLITGCGHPGVEKLVTRAETLYGQKVVGVVGGLHYGDASTQIKPDILFLQSRKLKLAALSPHDSGPAVIEVFRAAFPQAYQDILLEKAIRYPGH